MREERRHRAGIIGGGLMGDDLFNYLSGFDIPLVWAVRGEAYRDALAEKYSRRLDRMLRNGAIEREEYESRRDNVRIAASIDELEGCDIVIEAVTEDLEMKRSLLACLERVIAESAVIATNTSSIPLPLLATALRKRNRFAGLHFFYPVNYRNIVELVITDETGEGARDVILGLLSLMGRRHIELPEREAFLLNRVILDFQAASYRVHRERGVSLAALDSIVKRVIHPAGVFEFFDGVGIDVALAAIRNYSGNSADPRFYAPLVDALQALAAAGRMGRKSGAGFHDYPHVESGGEDLPDDGDRRAIRRLLQSVYVNSAFRAMERRICPDAELDSALREFLGAEGGPLSLADEIGRDEMRTVLIEEYNRTGFDAYRPSALI